MLKQILLVSCLVVLIGCTKQVAPKSAKVAPAKVEKLPVETEIGRITLTADADTRLGIKLEIVREEMVERRRTVGGDVLIPAGKSVIVSAPFAGTISPPEGSRIPNPGERLVIGSSILRLEPILTPERDVPTPAEQVQMANARATLLAAIAVAQGDKERSQAEINAAKIAVERSTRLLADRAGARRAVDDAEALLNVAQSNFNAAQQRDDQLTKLLAELDKPPSERTASPLGLSAPQTGVLRSLAVTPGQAVTAGTTLFEVVDTDTMWIRVPVFVEMLNDIDAESLARIVPLGAATPNATPSRSGNTSDENVASEVVAKPVVAPPSADPLSSTVDLYYDCPNKNGDLRPGQRVGVQLVLRGDDRGLTAPKKSILYDIFGGTWVYVQTAEHVYERQRVLIRYVLDNRVVLAEGPAVGTQVVTDGAAELFGTEFGAGK